MKKYIIILTVSVLGVLAFNQALATARKTNACDKWFIAWVFPKRMKQAALFNGDPGLASVKILAICETFARQESALHGDLSIKLNKNINGKQGMQLAKDLNYKSLCTNLYRQFSQEDFSDADITSFALIMDSTVPKEYGNYSLSDWKKWLKDARAEGGRDLKASYAAIDSNTVDGIISIARLYSDNIATIDEDNPDKVFWHGFKIDMLVDLMRGADIKKYTDPFGKEVPLGSLLVDAVMEGSWECQPADRPK